MAETPIQNFNHIAMSVPADLLDDAGRDDILAFYGGVFGWSEMPGMTEPGRVMVLRAHSNEQFVFLVAEDEPMRSGSLDHFGLSVRSPEELDGILERAEKFEQHDDRVEIVPRKTEDFKAVKLHSFYVRFLLPLHVEVQCYEWAEGLGPDSLPKS